MDHTDGNQMEGFEMVKAIFTKEVFVYQELCDGQKNNLKKIKLKLIKS